VRAINHKHIGGPSVLKISDVPDPVPQKGEVRVNLAYAGINFAEILSRKGLYGWAPKKPYIIGMEGSGIIDQVGEGVDPTRIGEKVVVGAQYGCYAEKIAVPEAQALPVLPYLSMKENAALLVNYMTAWVALVESVRLQKNESVLITAAAGGVGTAAIQIASKLGCPTYGMVGSIEKMDLVKELGASEVFNYRQKNWIAEFEEKIGNVDVVLEMVGGEVNRQSYKFLNYFGRVIIVGYASLNPKLWNPISWWRTWRDIPRVNLMEIAMKSAGAMATHLGYLLKDPQKMSQVYDRMKNFLLEHNIRPVISRLFPFEDAGKAHAFIESRQSTGKVLLKINGQL
jgi:NADPH2:quinone reductase